MAADRGEESVSVRVPGARSLPHIPGPPEVPDAAVHRARENRLGTHDGDGHLPACAAHVSLGRREYHRQGAGLGRTEVVVRRVVVIGAGAAGSMAAIFAAEAGAETLLLERTRDGGRKILISGGGRCNVLPMVVEESRFVTDSSPNVLRKMLRSYPLDEQVAFFETDLGIP